MNKNGRGDGAQASVNARAGALVDTLVAEAGRYRVGVSQGPRGETLIDLGAKQAGGIAAGVALAEICLGGLGTVRVEPDPRFERWPWRVAVSTNDPVTACLASQYAGWSLSEGEFFALGSGPARALARKEPVFDDLSYRDPQGDRATLALEAGGPPPAAILERVAGECGVAPERLAVLFAPTSSLAGSVQVVARVLEVALLKAHALHFPLERIADGLGTAPLSPPHPDFVTAMGRTNDAIIYGGTVQLFVSGPAEAARELAEGLPSRTSRDYGRPFAEVFKAFDHDFYKVDAMLFSPAVALVTALETGETFRAGALAPDLLDASFGG